MKKSLLLLLSLFLGVSLSYAADSFDISMQSDAGEYIGQGKFWKFSSTKEDTIKSFKMYEMVEDQWYVLEVSSFSLGTPIRFAFEGKEWLLQVWNHYPAKRYPSNDTYNGIDVSGDGKGCNTLLGGFYVHEIVFSNGKISKAAIDFVQYCEENTAKGLYGSVRYNSSIANTCSSSSCSKVKELIEWWNKGNENQQNKNMSDDELQAFLDNAYETLNTKTLPTKFPRLFKQCNGFGWQALGIETSSKTYFNHQACGKKYIFTLKSADRYVQKLFPLHSDDNDDEEVTRDEVKKVILFLDKAIAWVDHNVEKLKQQKKYTETKEIYRGSISSAFEIMKLYVQVLEKSL